MKLFFRYLFFSILTAIGYLGFFWLIKGFDFTAAVHVIRAYVTNPAAAFLSMPYIIASLLIATFLMALYAFTQVHGKRGWLDFMGIAYITGLQVNCAHIIVAGNQDRFSLLFTSLASVFILILIIAFILLKTRSFFLPLLMVPHLLLWALIGYDAYQVERTLAFKTVTEHLSKK